MWAKMGKEKGRMECVQRLLWLKYGDVAAVRIYIPCYVVPPRICVWTPSGSHDAKQVSNQQLLELLNEYKRLLEEQHWVIN